MLKFVVVEDIEPALCNVHKKDLSARGFSDFSDWKKRRNSLYVGRRVFYVEGTFDSKWRNIFTVKKHGLGKCLELYEEHVRKNLWEDLPELQGMELGCWCYPGPCHGEVLIRLYREHRRSL